MDLSTSEKTVTIRVHDHGLGIPREQRDKIFDRFYRASGPKQRAIPGLGMGLYIVAEIVKGHGGNITVDRTVGKGSTFTVTLPLMRDVIAVDARGVRVNCDDDGGGRCFGTAAAAITDQIGPFPTFVISEQHSYIIQEE